jgi:Peptidase family S41/N-terminal domain of Peptidase_S41 in eukaryotic IRBP
MMLRFLYRCALDMHPPAFRRRFADEMLFIFDQQSSKSAAWKLLIDALISTFRQWLLRPECRYALSAESPQTLPDGIPTFYTIRPFRPRRAAVVHGIVLTTLVFCLTCFAIRYSWIRVLHVHIREVPFEESAWAPPAPTPASDQTAAAPQRRPAVEAGVSNPIPAAASRVEKKSPQLPATARPQGNASTPATPAESGPPELNATATASPSAKASRQASFAMALPPATVENLKLGQAERHRVVRAAIENLNKYYVEPQMAKRMADALLRHELAGDDNAITDPEAFATLLTDQLQNASHDRYVGVIYSTEPTVSSPRAPTPAEVAEYRSRMMESNCTFEKIEILPHNIGYLKFNSFPDAGVCGSIAARAMKKLNGADAIIFDLRDNPGGYANMVALLATYLFDRPTHLNDFYNRSENSTEQSWTLKPIPGNKLADKPVFVLTSSRTFSAAEAFSYDLKMLKRATLVGETTSGGGHMGAVHRIDDQFAIRIPEIKVTNPISNTNWQGTGVEPDVKVKAADALQTAERLALAKLPRS